MATEGPIYSSSLQGCVVHVDVVHVDIDVDVDAVAVDVVGVEDVDVDVLFVDDDYVCSSVAGWLCSAHKAHYPQNFGVTAPL